MQWIECSVHDQLFEHDPGGEVRWFNVTAMRTVAHATVRIGDYRAAPGAVELVTTDLDGMGAAWMRRERGIEERKLAALTEGDLREPVIICEMGDGTHLLVDGHHRWVKRAERGDTTICAYRFPLGTWEPFLVTDLMAIGFRVRA